MLPTPSNGNMEELWRKIYCEGLMFQKGHLLLQFADAGFRSLKCRYLNRRLAKFATSSNDPVLHLILHFLSNPLFLTIVETPFWKKFLYSQIVWPLTTN